VTTSSAPCTPPGTYEPALLRFLHDALRPGDVVLDVGAHIGVHALTAAARLRELARPYEIPAACPTGALAAWPARGLGARPAESPAARPARDPAPDPPGTRRLARRGPGHLVHR
jgi:hypothetical protein